MTNIREFIAVNKYGLVTMIFIVIKLSLHFFTNTNYELHRDELLYFNMGDHLSFGYATVPPLTGLFAFAVKSVFGYSVFGIRLFPALLGTLNIFIISQIIRQMGGGLTALVIAASSFLLSPGFLLIDTLFTPNVFEHFLWLLATWLILKITTEGRPELWLPAGLVLGISFLFKYSVVFFVAGFFIVIVFSQYKKYLRSWYFYAAIIAGIIIITPNLIWQSKHGWPVVFHMSELNRTQLSDMDPGTFLTDLFSLNLAATLVWLFGLFSLLFFRKEKRYRFLGAASLTVIMLFILMKGKGYYVLGVIPFLFASGGYAIEKYLSGRVKPLRNLLLTLIAAVSLVAMPTGLPLLSFEEFTHYRTKTDFLKIYPFYRWEDSKVHAISQLYADMTGWSELAEQVAGAYYTLTEDERKECTIFGLRNYGCAGAVHFYGHKYGLPEPVTFHESYVYWAPDTIPSGPMIYINSDKDDINELFNEVTETGCVRNEYFRENGLKIFLCRSPKTDTREVYRILAISEKAKMEVSVLPD